MNTQTTQPRSPAEINKLEISNSCKLVYSTLFTAPGQQKRSYELSKELGITEALVSQCVAALKRAGVEIFKPKKSIYSLVAPITIQKPVVLAPQVQVSKSGQPTAQEIMARLKGVNKTNQPLVAKLFNKAYNELDPQELLDYQRVHNMLNKKKLTEAELDTLLQAGIKPSEIRIYPKTRRAGNRHTKAKAQVKEPTITKLPYMGPKKSTVEELFGEKKQLNQLSDLQTNIYWAYQRMKSYHTKKGSFNEKELIQEYRAKYQEQISTSLTHKPFETILKKKETV